MLCIRNQPYFHLQFILQQQKIHHFFFFNWNILHNLGSSLLKLSTFLHRPRNQMKYSSAMSLPPNVLLLSRWTKKLISFKYFSNSIWRIVDSLKSWDLGGVSAHFLSLWQLSSAQCSALWFRQRWRCVQLPRSSTHSVFKMKKWR